MIKSKEDMTYLMKLDVNTGAGIFTGYQSRQLAELIYLRFGKNLVAAHEAWKRMLENNCSLACFERILRGNIEKIS